jgi:hypothetical protein
MNNKQRCAFLNSLSSEARDEFMDFDEKARTVHERNKHKLEGIKNI